VLVSLISVLVSGCFVAGDVAPQVVTLRGEVVELAEVVKDSGLRVDAGPIARQVVVKAEDGTIVPLLCDEASRAFFDDQRLRHRRVEIQARRFEGLPYVQVTAFQVEHEERFRTPEYYCDICTISVRYPQACPCCQGEMELRMKPEAP
jgi:hypothetical protein